MRLTSALLGWLRGSTDAPIGALGYSLGGHAASLLALELRARRRLRTLPPQGLFLFQGQPGYQICCSLFK